MACNSIAMTTAKIAKVVLSVESMRDMLAQMLGIDASKVRIDENRVIASLAGNGYVMLEPSYYNSAELELKVEVYGNAQATQKLSAELQPKFESALIVAQQTTIMKRLAQLGKLSKIQGKDNGVSLRLEINI